MSARDIHIANVVRHWGAQEPWSLFPENVRPNGYVGKSAWAYLDKIARECSIKQGVDLVVKECSKAGLHEYNLKQAAGTLREGERPKVERVSHKYVAGAAFNLSNGDIVGDKTGSVFGGVQRSVARSKKSTKAARKRVKDESNDDEDEDMSDDTTDTEPLFGGKRPSKSKSAIGRSLGVRAGCLRKVATKMAPSFSVSAPSLMILQVPHFDISLVRVSLLLQPQLRSESAVILPTVLPLSSFARSVLGLMVNLAEISLPWVTRMTESTLFSLSSTFRWATMTLREGLRPL